MSDKNHLNVVWICTDQQRYDTIAALGNPYINTPHLDRLCREGTAFRNAFVQNPVCTPSRASFLTGRYPRSTRVCYNGNDYFPDDEILITKRLVDNGYTCGLTGKLHLSSAYGRMETRCDDGYTFMRWSHHPFDGYEEGVNHYQDWLKEKGVEWKKSYRGRYADLSVWPPEKNEGFSGKEVGVPADIHQTTWCVEEAINFIEQQKGNPWLVSINPFDPHPPLDPPQAYKDRLKVEDMPLPLWKEGELKNKPPHQQKDYVSGGQDGAADSIIGKSDADKRELVRDYYAQIELIDDQVGRLLDYLEKTGQRENTLIIFMSDHGETNGDHGLYWKGAYFYESIVHVPLIFSCPGLVKQGLISDALVELVDVCPTILELIGMDIPRAVQGKSLAGILTGKKDPSYHKDSVYCEYYYSLKKCHDGIYATMYRDTRYKLVVYHGEAYGELYDLEKDPCEYDNLYDLPEYATLRAELMKRSFDQAVLYNVDESIPRLYTY